MKLHIPFPEILDIIQKEVGMNLNVGFSTLNKNTVTVHYEQKVKMFLGIETKIPISMNVIIKKYENGILHLVYDGGTGIEFIMKGVKKLAPKLLNLKFIEFLPESNVSVHLSKIEKVQDALKLIDIQTIYFDEAGANVRFTLK